MTISSKPLIPVPTRLEDQRFITGQGRYTDDLAPPDALQVVFLRSPVAHAIIKSIDATLAQGMPGVQAIYTGADVVADGLGHLPAIVEIKNAQGLRHREPMRLPISPDRVRHVGEIVAMVIAETLAQAQDAAEAIDVVYEELPALVIGSAALQTTAVQLHDDAPGNLMCHWRKGDETAVAQAFSNAAHIIKLDQQFNRLLGNYLETRAAFTEHDEASGIITLTLSSQGAHIPHRLLCDHVLHWPRNQLRVITPDVGGGFGPKFTLYPEAALLPWAARKLKTSLRWVCERTESFISDNHARDLQAEMTLALDAQGRFLGLKVDAIANFGAYVSMFAPAIATSGMAKVISGLYRLPAIYIDMKCAFTNTVPVDAFRGAGKPETLALLERLIDVAAHTLGLDPVALRRLNLVTEFPYTTALGYTYESGDPAKLFDQGLHLANLSGLEDRKRTSEDRKRLRGFGIACHLHGSGGIADENARIVVHDHGLIEAYSGTQSQGQGHETIFAQVISQHLGIPFTQIRIIQGDTARIAQGGGTGGSSSTIIGATTLTRASDIIILKGREHAADHLEVALPDIIYRNSQFEVIGTDRRIGLFEVAALMRKAGHELSGDAGFVDRVESWSMGVMTCEVEIDPDTGEVWIDRLNTVSDIGQVMNFTLAEGQVHGGIIAGLGQAVLENACYDPASGQLLAGSWMDYAMPRADHTPQMTADWLSAPSTNNALGIKGLGELPTNGAPAAIANAVMDALKPFGVRHIPSPVTPERIWRAIHKI